ncbi:MAG: ubiquinol-cytochrome c reductase iron-sulfur subunit [Thermoanaerobaculia bacterium]
MRLLDDLAISDTPKSASRRRFLGRMTWASLGVAVSGSLMVCVRYLWPSVLFELPTRFAAGRMSDLERRRVLYLRDRALYLVRDEKGLFTQSAVCTHLGCLTRPNAREDGFFCPCHGSEFSLDGRVLKGPAPKSLPHFKLERRGEDLWVDLAHEEELDGRIVV